MQPHDGRQNEASPAGGIGTGVASGPTSLSERTLFHAGLHADEAVDLHALAGALVERELTRASTLIDEGSPAHLAFFPYEPVAFEARMAALLVAPATATDRWDRQHHAFALRQLAPTALLSGAWLQNVSGAATNHLESVARVFALFSDLVGDGRTAKNYGNAYRDALGAVGARMPEIATRAFAEQPGLLGSAFCAPAFQIGLSLFPRTRFAEILGYTLGYAHGALTYPQLARLEELDQLGIPSSFFANHLPGSEPATRRASWARQAVQRYLEEQEQSHGRAERDQQWRRIWTGLVAAWSTQEANLRELDAQLRVTPAATPRALMIELVRRKAPYARNAHRGAQVAGRPINDWFQDGNLDAAAFLDGLAASPVITPGAPERSRFFTELTPFGGPMFRIFSPEEIQLVELWIRSLAPTAPIAEVIAPPVPSTVGQISVTAVTHAVAEPAAVETMPSTRQLYHELINVEHHPAILPVARRWIDNALAKAAEKIDKKELPPQLQIFDYTAAALHERIMKIFAMQVDGYKPLGDRKPRWSKRQWVYSIEQAAPISLVDGSWVQNACAMARAHTEIGARLFHIYADEIGNGNTVYNHPNVYRRLMESVGLQMPEVTSKAFVEQPSLIDAAFDIPTLWMGISQFPGALYPELLGLNLFIELNEVGGFYMEACDSLRHWGVDSTYYELHNSIDNLSTGHTMMARESIVLYLDEILAHDGREAMQRAWHRIWSGYVVQPAVVGPKFYMGIHRGTRQFLDEANPTPPL